MSEHPDFRAALQAIVNRHRSQHLAAGQALTSWLTGGSPMHHHVRTRPDPWPEFDRARESVGRCLSAAVDAAFAATGGDGERFTALAPAIREEVGGFRNEIANLLYADHVEPTPQRRHLNMTAQGNLDEFGRWTDEMIEGAIVAGQRGTRDARLAPYREDAYSRWSKRLSRMQIVVGAVAFLLFLIYLGTGGLGGGG